MSKLNHIIASILRDIAEAQHQANRYSIQVCGEYSKGQALGNYPVPGVRISDLEMELKYALVETQEESNHNQPTDAELQEFIRELSAQSCKAAINSVLYVWRDILNEGASDAVEHAQMQQIAQKLRQDFSAFLQGRIQEKLARLGNTLLHPENKIDVTKATAGIMEVVRKHLLEHAELHVFTSRGTDEQKQKNASVVQGYIRTLTARLTKEFQPAEKKEGHRLDMLISTDALAQLPAERIHSLRFRISPSFGRLVQVEEDGVTTEQLVPADN